MSEEKIRPNKLSNSMKAKANPYFLLIVAIMLPTSAFVIWSIWSIIKVPSSYSMYDSIVIALDVDYAVLSGDGAYIAFVRNKYDGTKGIYTVKVDGTDETERLLVNDYWQIENTIQWLGSNKIVYIKKNDEGYGQFWTLDITTMEHSLLIKDALPQTNSPPRFAISPMQNYIVFSIGDWQWHLPLILIDLETQEITHIEVGVGQYCSFPTWSPDNAQIIYYCLNYETLKRPIYQQIWLFDLIEKTSELLWEAPEDKALYGNMSWSPDNEWFAYTIIPSSYLWPWQSTVIDNLWLAPVENNKPNFNASISVKINSSQGRVDIYGWRPNMAEILISGFFEEHFSSNDDKSPQTVLFFLPVKPLNE
jgi:Tol biopolymer transport system component